MLQFFHKHQKIVYGIVFLAAIMLVLSGFGFNWSSGSKKISAITIDDEQVSFAEFQREVRGLEQRYRSMFGKSYEQFAGSLHLNQQVADRKTAEVLALRQAKKLNLAVGKNEFDTTLRTEVFPKGYNADYYRAVLNQMQMTQEEFEAELRNGALRAQFASIMKDASRPSNLEAAAMARQKETTYDLSVLESDPNAVKPDAPTEEGVAAYYKDHESDFEVPKKVSYDFIVLRPDEFVSSVPVSDDDIELEYADNPQKYTLPESVKVRHLQFNFSAESDPAKMNSIKEKAEAALEKARSGEKFELLVLKYSEDVATKTIGGDLGWVQKGKMAPQFDDVVFKTPDNTVGDLVSTSYGYHIVKVESRRSAELKKLGEVREEIRSELRRKEAPAYSADKARELYDTWTKRKVPLSDIAKENTLTLSSTAKLLSKDEDPDLTLAKLTATVIEYPDADKEILVELPAFSVIVSVKERKDVSIQPLLEVKNQIVLKLTTTAARDVARAKADVALKKWMDSKDVPADQFAKSEQLILKAEKGISLERKNEGLGANPQLQESLVAVSAANTILPKVFETGGKFYVVRVSGVQRPPEVTDQAKLATYLDQAENRNSDSLVTSLINHAKATSKIVVSPGILTQ